MSFNREKASFYRLFDPEGEGITVTFQSDATGIFYKVTQKVRFKSIPQVCRLGPTASRLWQLTLRDSKWIGLRELSINGQPDSPALLITLDSPTTKDDLTLTITEGLDPEEDTITHSILWKQNGAVIDDLTDSPTVTADYTNQGDVWQVTVTNDGRGRST